MTVIKSFSFEQDEILRGIADLYCGGRFDVDATYGNGGFYKKSGVPTPSYRFDLDPQCDATELADSRFLPLQSASVESVVFGPPFLTYVRAGREGNGNMVMSKRFAGYWTYGELQDHYVQSLAEFSRVLRVGGVVVLKCQDIVHNHALHPTHVNVVNWAKELGFRLKDLYVLAASHRMPSPNRQGTQRHARIFHSYFLVLELRSKNREAVDIRLAAALDGLASEMAALRG